MRKQKKEKLKGVLKTRKKIKRSTPLKRVLKIRKKIPKSAVYQTEDEGCAWLDGCFKHPFTSIVTGPSGSGKSTFVKNLLDNQQLLISIADDNNPKNTFDYVKIFGGTTEYQNPILASLRTSLPRETIVSIIDINAKYKEPNDFKLNFASDLRKELEIEMEKKTKGCIIFDDLMGELSKCGAILVDLFTKLSTHASITVIHITQNLFHQSPGASDHTTLYRNTKALVLFNSLMDHTTISIVSQRLGGNTQKIKTLMNLILAEHRYIVIRGDLNTNTNLRFSSDIFNLVPCPQQRVFSVVDG